MFNLKQHKISTPTDLLSQELGAFGIVRQHDGSYLMNVGDEKVHTDKLIDCKKYLYQSINEIKKYLKEKWEDIAHLADVMAEKKSSNESSIDNLLFLNAVKKSLKLSGHFSQLATVKQSLTKLLYADPSDFNIEDIQKFNYLYLSIRSLHSLVMEELYRLRVVSQNLQLNKTAQVSGPWSNLDLPMKERVWEWDEGEDEYFSNRNESIKNQMRYNPEYDKYGFYYVWNEPTRDPYRFEDMSKDSPYKSRLMLTIP